MSSVAKCCLEAVNLVVPPQLLPSVAEYYTKLLGMVEAPRSPWAASDVELKSMEVRSFAFAKSPESCAVTFAAWPAVTRMNERSRADIYWKIGLALEDVDSSGEAYASQGGEWNGAKQFLDVGYLGHTQDPAGFAIEFLQTTFEDSRAVREERRAASGSGGPLAQARDPVVGQITTRTADAQACLDFYQGVLGMKLLCIEPVTQYGFELYFLGFTEDTPPSPEDLRAVENREWLYQRPYTTLEVQASLKEGSRKENTDLPEGAGGFESLSISVPEETYEALRGRFPEGQEGVLRDPDGMKIRLTRQG